MLFELLMKILGSKKTKWSIAVSLAITFLGAVVGASFVLLAIYVSAVQHQKTGQFFWAIMLLFALGQANGFYQTWINQRAIAILLVMPSIKEFDHMIDTWDARLKVLEAAPSRQTDPAVELEFAEFLRKTTQTMRDVRTVWAGRAKDDAVNVEAAGV